MKSDTEKALTHLKTIREDHEYFKENYIVVNYRGEDQEMTYPEYEKRVLEDLLIVGQSDLRLKKRKYAPNKSK